jgi:hypothetical protein
VVIESDASIQKQLGMKKILYVLIEIFEGEPAPNHCVATMCAGQDALKERFSRVIYGQSWRELSLADYREFKESWSEFLADGFIDNEFGEIRWAQVGGEPVRPLSPLEAS